MSAIYIQGDHDKMPPMKMLITLTVTSIKALYLVQINSRLCMTFAQSFKSESQTVVVLCPFQYMPQTSSTALQANFQTTRKIVNNTDAFLHTYCPNPSCNCSLQFSYGLGVGFIDSIFQITPQIQIWGGVKSGECAAHSMPHLLLMSRPPNRCLSHCSVS